MSTNIININYEIYSVKTTATTTSWVEVYLYVHSTYYNFVVLKYRIVLQMRNFCCCEVQALVSLP